ncbi:unnamed protein product [Mycena citricolor]|uniref:Transmembrane protein n=1 Tax=Mycena citricolor TaxID=2018698 RepID=A0AAD2GUD0_9AGAR|nr:unnamed protein product [Mycena citricolor]
MAASGSHVDTPPGTPFTTSETRFSTTSTKRFRESTHLIPTPSSGKDRPKNYEGLYLPVATGGCWNSRPDAALGNRAGSWVSSSFGATESSWDGSWFCMRSVCLERRYSLKPALYTYHLEMAASRSPRKMFSLVFHHNFYSLLSPVCTFVIPVGYFWRNLDWTIRWYQPYVNLLRGNATVEESIQMDYTALGTASSVLAALKFNHRVIFWSSMLAASTYIYASLAGAIFQIHTGVLITYTQAQSTRSLGLDPDVAQLNAFAAAAGFVQAAVFNDLGDPPFVSKGWSTAQFVFPRDIGLNGSMTVNTTAIRSNPNCTNPTSTPVVTVINSTSSTISATSLTGCTQTVTIATNVSDLQYSVAPAPCGSSKNTDEQFQPIVFWFFQNQSSSNKARAVFCDPSMDLFYVHATADLASGNLTGVVPASDYLVANNVTGPPINGVPYNAVIFRPNVDPFIQARATATRVGVPGAIFRSALQSANGLQAIFGEPNGFLDIASNVYRQHLAVTAKSIYFVNQNQTLSSTQSEIVPRLIIDSLPGHFLAFLLFFAGFLGIFLQLIHRRQRRNLFLASPPGSIATAVALTNRSGWGELLLPYDSPEVIEKKLHGLRFRLDKRTGAIVADDYGTSFDDDAAPRGPDDAMMSLLGKHQGLQSSTAFAQEAALEASGYPHETYKTPYDH